MRLRQFRYLFALVVCFTALTSCTHVPWCDCGKVDLNPRDTRPLLSTAVDDETEAAILKERHQIEPFDIRGSTLFFRANNETVASLEELGYEVTTQRPENVENKVVRVAKKGTEEELLNAGIELINRESDYWIVRGTLAQLTSLTRLGYVLTPLLANEPMRREIKVTVPTRDDVQWINELHVDIFSVQETKAGLVITGGAYDAQIDEIRRRNYIVEIKSRY